MAAATGACEVRLFDGPWPIRQNLNGDIDKLCRHLELDSTQRIGHQPVHRGVIDAKQIDRYSLRLKSSGGNVGVRWMIVAVDGDPTGFRYLVFHGA